MARSDPRGAQPADQREGRHGVAQVAGAEDVQQQPDDGVGGHLGHDGRDERAHRVGRPGVGVRKPGVQGKERHLERQAQHHEERARQDRAAPGQGRQQARHVLHVERAGGEVEKAHAQQVEAAGHGPQHQVAEGRHGGPAAVPAGDQGIGGQGGDLQEDVEVEEVPGEHHAGEPGQQQEHHRVHEQRLAGHLEAHQRPRSHQRQEPQRGQQQRHEGRERVEHELDAQRRRPAAHGVVDLALAQDPDQAGGRSAPGERRRHHGQTAPQRGAPEPAQQRQGCEGEKDERRRDRKLARLHQRERSRIVSSSRVPCSRWMAISSASATPVSATPTTMAVSTITWGRGFT